MFSLKDIIIPLLVIGVIAIIVIIYLLLPTTFEETLIGTWEMDPDFSKLTNLQDVFFYISESLKKAYLIVIADGDTVFNDVIDIHIKKNYFSDNFTIHTDYIDIFDMDTINVQYDKENRFMKWMKDDKIALPLFKNNCKSFPTKKCKIPQLDGDIDE